MEVKEDRRVGRREEGGSLWTGMDEEDACKARKGILGEGLATAREAKLSYNWIVSALNKIHTIFKKACSSSLSKYLFGGRGFHSNWEATEIPTQFTKDQRSFSLPLWESGEPVVILGQWWHQHTSRQPQTWTLSPSEHRFDTEKLVGNESRATDQV